MFLDGKFEIVVQRAFDLPNLDKSRFRKSSDKSDPYVIVKLVDDKKKEIKIEKPKPVLKLGDRVRMQDGKAIGTIDAIEKGKAIVNYGIFTTNVNIDTLELVEAVK